MQAVILAAGKSTRTYPLTLTRPKPLLKVANKTLLEHNLDNLRDFVDEAIIVVGYKKKLIKKCLGNKYKSIKIKYAGQKKQLGTANAVSVAEPFVKNRFILLMGDDIYPKNDIKKCLKHKYVILTTKVKNPRSFGAIIAKKNVLVDFIEKPKKFVSDLVSTAFYVLDKKIFKCIKKIKKSERNEFELPDAIKLMSRYEKIFIVKTEKWLPVTNAYDLLKADKILRKGKNYIGANAKVNGIVANSSVGNGCIIKGIVKNSIIMDRAMVDGNSVVEGSVIGENANVKGKISNSIIADNANIINAVIENSKITPNKTIKNKTIKNDEL